MDIYIINTCSVTNESDKKSRKMINRAKRIIVKLLLLLWDVIVRLAVMI